MLEGLRARLRALFRRTAVDRDLQEEIAEHLRRETARQVALGMEPAAARDAARRAFGNPAVHAESARDAWGWTWLEQAAQDLRYGLRALLRSPTFTAVSVLSLALGLGVNTTVFGLIHGILMAPLAVSSPDGLVSAARVGTDGPDPFFSRTQFEALRAAGRIALTTSRDLDNLAVGVGDDEDYTNVEAVGPGYYASLGLTTRYGRVIADDEAARGDRVAVIGERYATRWFPSPAAAVGKVLRIKGRPFVVVGVTSAAWRGITYPGEYTVAITETAARSLVPGDGGDRFPLYVFGRLAAGATRTAAQAELDGILSRCCASATPEHVALADMAHGIGGGKDDARSLLRPVLYALMAAVLLVLLIAAANVGTLQLLRGVAREREIAVRLALGSSRGRIVRQLFTESALLGCLGVAMALLLAGWAAGVLARAMPDFGPAYVEMVRFRPGGPVLAFALLAGAAVTVLVGLAPALRATRPDVHGALKSGVRSTEGGSRRLLGRGLVVAQVALALVLVTTAALLVATLRNLTSQDVGVSVPGLMATGVETRGTVYEPVGIVPEYSRVLQAAAAVRGVTAAGMTTLAPLFGGRNAQFRVSVAGETPAGSAIMAGVTPGYFETMGIRLLAGRSFGAQDGVGAERVAVLSRSVAHRLFGERGAIGREIRLEDDSSGPLRVVGEVTDVSVMGPRAGATPMFYRPLDQIGPWPYVGLCWRTRSDDPAITPALIAAVKAAAPGIRVRNVATARDRLDGWLIREILVASLTGLFGLLALGLSAIGLYGVIAFGVARRTNEIGVRMALGARRNDVLALIMRQSAALTLAGLAIGAPLTLLAARALRSMLYGLSATDPAMLGLAVLILLAVAAAAGLVPAVRAAHIDPLAALRSE